MFSKEVGSPTSRTGVKKEVHHPAADTAAVVTIEAVAGRQHVVQMVQWSYSTSPTGGSLTIAVAGSTVWKVDITASGPGGFSMPITGGTNQEIVVTLATGTGSCVGKLNVQYTTEHASDN